MNDKKECEHENGKYGTYQDSDRGFILTKCSNCKKVIESKKCKHENGTYEQSSMSFIFIKCNDCDLTIDSMTNRDPTIYNRLMNSNRY